MYITIPLQSVDHLAFCVKERLRGVVTSRRTYKEEKSEEICGPFSDTFLFDARSLITQFRALMLESPRRNPRALKNPLNPFLRMKTPSSN